MFDRQLSEFEEAAADLESSGQYRVLRRIPPFAKMPLVGLQRGLFIDVETTGLNPRTDEIIELGMAPFAYDPDGLIVGVGAVFAQYRMPAVPIPPRVTELTGIDFSKVAFLEIDPDEVAAFAGSPSVIIAHNAAFDRPFVERLCPALRGFRWACSLTQVPWESEGFESPRLAYLLMQMRLFHDPHSAADDCLGALTALSRPLPKSGRTGLAHLLRAVRTPTLRFWALGAPFEARGLLKAWGYRWNPGDDGRPRAWYRDVPEADRDAESAFLRDHIYIGFADSADPRIVPIDAYDRFSDRC